MRTVWAPFPFLLLCALILKGTYSYEKHADRRETKREKKLMSSPLPGVKRLA